MADTTWQVLTVGYSTWTITEFVELLKVADRDFVQQSSNTKAASGSNAGSDWPAFAGARSRSSGNSLGRATFGNRPVHWQSNAVSVG
ncbi:hypothetical protein FHX06_006542 [Rhizobium sp. BK512]|nr:hypothetical protein [Rhizobium sp. BK512]